MTHSKAQTVEQYLDQLAPERKTIALTVRDEILKNLPNGFAEVMQYGMISYIIPFSRYPNTYNKQPLAIVSLASQKNYFSLHLMCVYMSEELHSWFLEEYKASGKKLDMGKGCLRFKKTEDIPLELIGTLVSKVSVDGFIQTYEEARKKTKAYQKAS